MEEKVVTSDVNKEGAKGREKEEKPELSSKGGGFPEQACRVEYVRPNIICRKRSMRSGSVKKSKEEREDRGRLR